MLNLIIFIFTYLSNINIRIIDKKIIEKTNIINDLNLTNNKNSTNLIKKIINEIEFLKVNKIRIIIQEKLD
tara:strand:+ start:103 stop:315 length:213 start_codon:yes stop_codon:yes gene_type:complete